MLSLTIFVVLCAVHSIFCVPALYDKEPLLLTPYIEQGRIEEAKDASRVDSEQFNGTISYSGYFTVNKEYNSNLFMWFFPSEVNYQNAPLVLWLDGGPGDSCLASIFTGVGPLSVDHNGMIGKGKHSLTKQHSVLYIDNPVGTGYSFTDENGYAENQTIIGSQLYEALTQFFFLFSQWRKNDFYVFGESYGGKYVPAICYTIYQKNINPNNQMINLKGLMMANAWSDPEHQSVYSEYLYQIGLIDFNSKLEILQHEEVIRKHIDDEEWQAAMEEYNKTFFLSGSLVMNMTGFDGIHNYLQPITNKELYNILDKYFQTKHFRNLIHVGDVPYKGTSAKVFNCLQSDIMKSVASWVSELLSHYKVIYFNGQLDIMVAYPMAVNFLKNLKFSGMTDYLTAVRQQWYVDGDLAGYVKQAGNLTEALVRNAGHIACFDQPRWSLDLMTRFTYNKSFV